MASFILNCNTVAHSSHRGAFSEDLLRTRRCFPCWRSRQELIRYVTYLLGGRLAESNQKDTMPSHGGKSYEESRIAVWRWGGAQRYKLEVGRVVRLKGRKGAERTECGARAGQGHTSPRDLA